MCLRVRMCACVCVYVYVCVFVYVCVCVCARVRGITSLTAFTFTHTYTHAHARTHPPTPTQRCSAPHISRQLEQQPFLSLTHTHTHTNTHTHSLSHTYIGLLALTSPANSNDSQKEFSKEPTIPSQLPYVSSTDAGTTCGKGLGGDPAKSNYTCADVVLELGGGEERTRARTRACAQTTGRDTVRGVWEEGSGMLEVSLQHTATHCNTLQHTATHCNTVQHTPTRGVLEAGSGMIEVSSESDAESEANSLVYTASHLTIQVCVCNGSCFCAYDVSLVLVCVYCVRCVCVCVLCWMWSQMQIVSSTLHHS